MRATDLTSNNDAAVRLRDASPLRDLGQLLPHAKAHPYRGFIEIQLPGIEPFVMFSNNDDAVAMQAFWTVPFQYESHSLALWCAAAKLARAMADIGSYTGLFTLAAAAANRKTRVYAYEAVDFIFARAFVNIQANQFSNGRVNHLAISDKAGTMELTLRFGPTLLSSGSTLMPRASLPQGAYQKLVQTATLDGQEAGIPIDACKIDVEGAELMVLRGADRVLAQHKPLLLVEVLNDAQLSELRDYLAPRGYGCQFISEEDRKLHSNQELFWRSTHSRNVLFLHPEGHVTESRLATTVFK